jgi:inner membrane protease subunit 2
MAPNSDSKQPPDRPGGTSSWKPTYKPRVLSPELAKARSQNPSSSPSSSPFSANTAPSPTTATTTTTTTTTSSSSPFSLFSRFRAHYSALPSPVRRTFRALRILAPVIPIGIFFSEHVLQVMWVRGPSMTPYLNEDYAQMQTTSDMVLVNMWPWGSRRRLERGMVVTFR